MATFEQINLNSWEAFMSELVRLKAAHPPDVDHHEDGTVAGQLLFRGHADSDWKLETTLERYKPASLSLYDYYCSIWRAKTEIESYTGREWDIELPRTYLEKCMDVDQGFILATSDNAYDYMSHLRHHGFPSPLLDWTASPYIAAFFAFDGKSERTDRVAIYAFRDQTWVGKAAYAGQTAITLRGPYVRTHKRHFLQQCRYTICATFNGEWRYACHEDVAHSDPNVYPHQDNFWKFTLPRFERNKVLRYLDLHNLNAYSLFGSEESLMQTMAARRLLEK